MDSYINSALKVTSMENNIQEASLYLGNDSMDSSFNRWWLFFVPEFKVNTAEKCFAEYGDNLENGTVYLDIFRIQGCK